MGHEFRQRRIPFQGLQQNIPAFHRHLDSLPMMRLIEHLSQLVISTSGDGYAGKKYFFLIQDRPVLLLASEGFIRCIIGHIHVKSSEYPSYMYSIIL